MEKEGIRYSEEDHNLFLDLYDYLYLDAQYLTDNIYPGRDMSYIYRRVNKLVKNGYVQKMKLPLQEITTNHGNTYSVYSLAKKGVEEVRELLGDHVSWDSRWTDRTPLYVYHSLMLSHISGAFRKHQHERFFLHEWISEKRAFFNYTNNATDVIRPDGVAMIGNQQSGKTFGVLIEMERSRTRKEITRSKILRYNAYMEGEGYLKQDVFETQPSSMRVVFVSRKENEMKRLMTHSKALTGPNGEVRETEIQTPHVDVLYTTYDRFLEDPWGKIFWAKDALNQDSQFHIYEKIK
ncbi:MULTISPECIES: replication-relaxation family protein [Bacillus cereus group]|uniref:replication-relaxation family protein n=1 Tax=Bacillus cereus group TaxID=86661 RepID=UPI0029C34E98|nr:replication-relaxation family protein [Bacillus cereus group sp. BfR-BA-01700]MDX5839049.1 replication-relaxation family protein [Bacillus cereus group sp. BfR-BA-01700]